MTSDQTRVIARRWNNYKVPCPVKSVEILDSSQCAKPLTVVTGSDIQVWWISYRSQYLRLIDYERKAWHLINRICVSWVDCNVIYIFGAYQRLMSMSEIYMIIYRETEIERGERDGWWQGDSVTIGQCISMCLGHSGGIGISYVMVHSRWIKVA